MKRGRRSALLRALPGGGLTVWIGLGVLYFGLVLQPALPTPPTELERHFPELAQFDTNLQDQLEKAWPESGKPETRDLFGALAHRHGPAAARVILRRLFDAYVKESTTFIEFGSADRDEEWAYPASLVGELADPALRAAMMRVLPDRRLGLPFRLRLVIALCRPRHRAALDVLLARVLDREENDSLREQILMRLDRLDIPAPRALRALLYEPFAHLDESAAAALCLMGDPEAPTLILDGLRSGECAIVVNRAAHALVPAIPVLGSSFAIPGGQDELDYERRVFRSAGETFRKWLDAHPEALDTEFERRRAALAASPRRKRALALKRFEDVVAAGEQVDVAAASMLLAGYPEDTRARVLDRVDRLAGFLRPKLATAADPEGKIAVLNRWLTQSARTVDATAQYYGLVSFLPSVFSHDHGNCLGYTTLYLAIADRLGLPLKPVGLPGHCFARWDDGRYVRDVETTDKGSTKVVSLAAGEPEPPSASRRQFLTWILRNECYTENRLGNFEPLATAARRILALDPASLEGRTSLAEARFHTVLDSRTEVISLLDSALDQATPEQTIDLLARAANYLLDYGEPSAALDYAERALRTAKRNRPRLEALEALCLAHLGRADEAEAILAALKGNFFGVRLAVGTFAHPDSVKKCTREIGKRAHDPVGAYTTAALALLDLGEEGKALELLDEVLERVESSKPLSISSKGFLIDGAHGRRLQAYFLARALALHALGRTQESRAAAARAKKLGRPCRLQLRVESLLAR